METLEGIDWDNFGFGLRPTDFMYVMKCGLDGEWQQGELQRFGNLEVSPSAGVLNYGQVRYQPSGTLCSLNHVGQNDQLPCLPQDSFEILTFPILLCIFYFVHFYYLETRRSLKGLQNES